LVCEEAFAALKAPVKRVAALDVPIPFNRNLERSVLPQVENIADAVRSIV
jgi:pyruvate dehydrogenase E1 component beta subunit